MLSFANCELELINYKHKKELMDIINIICNQGHSNFSIRFIINAIKNKDFETEIEMLKEDFDEIKNLAMLLDNEDIVILTKLLNYTPLSPFLDVHQEQGF